MILAYIFIALFSILLVVNVSLYIYMKKKNSILADALNNDLLNLSKRNGFYNKSFSLDNHTYKFRIYVIEEEKYSNGYSKLVIDGVDIISGFSPNNFNYVIQTAKDEFVSVQETNDITFLESDIDITELRKNKLERILKIKDE